MYCSSEWPPTSPTPSVCQHRWFERVWSVFWLIHGISCALQPLNHMDRHRNPHVSLRPTMGCGLCLPQQGDIYTWYVLYLSGVPMPQYLPSSFLLSQPPIHPPKRLHPPADISCVHKVCMCYERISQGSLRVFVCLPAFLFCESVCSDYFTINGSPTKVSTALVPLDLLTLILFIHTLSL